MPPAGFEPTISAGVRPQIYVLDRAATGTGVYRQLVTHELRHLNIAVYKTILVSPDLFCKIVISHDPLHL